MSRTKKYLLAISSQPHDDDQQPAHRYGYCQSVGVAVLHIARSMRRRVKFSGPRSIRMGKIIKSILKSVLGWTMMISKAESRHRTMIFHANFDVTNDAFAAENETEFADKTQIIRS